MKNFLIAAALTVAFVAPASAATFNLTADTVYREDGPAGPTPSNIPTGVTAEDAGEFSNGTGNPIFNLNGYDADIYGSVSSRRTTTTQWKDGWTMDFGAMTYDAVFEHATYNDLTYDAVLTVSGIGTFEMFGSNTTGTGSFSITGLTGVVTFELDPINDTVLGDLATDHREDMLWSIQTSKAAPVPLPAGAALGLTGIAALAMLRRRKKA